jgi:hypothetical protein
MSFRALYDHCQGLGTPVAPEEIRKKLRELLPSRPVRVLSLDLDPQKICGTYISPRNEDNLYYNGGTPGAGVICISKHLNFCWSRFVQVKELMHLFDDPLAHTSTGDELERLLGHFCDNISTNRRSEQMQSEYECFWMALSLMCPEHMRVDLARKRESHSITEREIAEQLKIPEKCVPALFAESYKDNIAFLCDHIGLH